MTEQFMAKSGLRTRSLVMGIIWLVLGAGGLTVSATGGVFLCVGAVMLWMWQWFGSHAIVELRADHLVVKAAPLASTKRALYREIREVTRDGPNKVTVHTEADTIRLPIAALEPDEAKRLVKAVRRRMKTDEQEAPAKPARKKKKRAQASKTKSPSGERRPT